MGIKHSVDRFLQKVTDPAGAVSVEFVIVLPVLLVFLLIYAAAAMHFAVSSDVQQLAHELARSALPYVGQEDWCSTVIQLWAEPLSVRLPLLDPARLGQIQCALDPQRNLAEVVVRYDTSGTPGSILGRLVGLNFDEMVRRSMVRP
jgi:hypothetical protein